MSSKLKKNIEIKILKHIHSTQSPLLVEENTQKQKHDKLSF